MPLPMFVLEGPPTPSFPLRELGGGESDLSHKNSLPRGLGFYERGHSVLYVGNQPTNRQGGKNG
jgi:hypothetical protein